MHIFLHVLKKNTNISFKKLVKSFCISLFFALLTVFVKVWIPSLGRSSSFLLFSSSIIVSAWFGGLVSGILSSCFAAICSFLFFGPSYPISFSDSEASLQAGVFFSEGLLLSFLVHRVKLLEEKFFCTNLLLEKMLFGVKDNAIIVLNAKGQIIHWSKSALDLTGYTKKQVEGKHFSFLYTREGKKEGLPKKEIKKAISNSQITQKNWILTKDGTRLFIEDETFSISDTAGKLDFLMKIFRIAKPESPMIKNIEKKEIRSPLIPTIIHA